MQIQLTLDGTRTGSEIASTLRTWANTFEHHMMPSGAAMTKPKAPKPAPVPADEEEEQEKAAASTNDDDGTFSLEEDETPAITRADMLKALKAHPSKEKVTKLLQTKFKVKNINELTEAQYGDVIAAVSKLK